MVDKNKPWFKLYDKGVPYSVIYPPLSIKQMFNSCAEKHPDRDYLIINDMSLPYGLVNMMARKAANAAYYDELRSRYHIEMPAP